MATDEEVLEQLASPTDPRWSELFQSVEVWRHNSTPFTWKNVEPDSRQMPWVDYDKTFMATFWLMVQVGLLLPNQQWRPLSLPSTWEAQVRDNEQYSLASCARYLTYIASKERFFEGMMANCIEDDLLVMTLDRARFWAAPRWRPKNS